MLDLNFGDVVDMKAIKVYVKDANGNEMELGYSPGRGRRFTFLFLGAHKADEEIDPTEALKAMGWNPPEE